jgi:hypothetical protein
LFSVYNNLFNKENRSFLLSDSPCFIVRVKKGYRL